MHEIFRDLPEALENNVNFPYRISYRPRNSLPVLPNIETEKIKDVDELLKYESKKGLNEKLNEYVLPYSDKENKIKRISIYIIM